MISSLFGSRRAKSCVFWLGEHAALVDANAFKAWLAPLRQCKWVVYAKRPFAGPQAVLAYLSRYTHRVREKTAVAFTAVVFKNGKRVANCYVRLGGMMSSHGMAYSGSENSSDNSYNEILDIQTNKHSLQWREPRWALSAVAIRRGD